MTEVMYGASPAWQPAVWLDDPSSQPPSATSIMPMLEQLQEELTQERLWGVASHNPATPDDSSRTFTPQVCLFLIAEHEQSVLCFDGSIQNTRASQALTLPLMTGFLTQHHMCLQELGTNVMLIRSLLDAVGAIAQVLGSEYASSGSFLRTALLPLLERLGDPCPAAAAAAQEIITVICAACGYLGLQNLVASNLDYIVDGLCAQLRDIDRFPR